MTKIIKYNIISVMLFAFLGCSSNSTINNNHALPFVVTFSKSITTDSVSIKLNLNDIKDRMRISSPGQLIIKDLNNFKIYYPAIDGDTAESIVFRVKFERNELLRPFELQLKEEKSEIVAVAGAETDDKLYSVTYLKTVAQYEKENGKINDWAVKIAESTIKSYPDPYNLDIFTGHGWNYTNGFFLNALFELYKKNGKEQYLSYIEKWYSYFINQDGSLNKEKFKKENQELDDILPGRSLLYFYQKNPDEKYKKASDELIDQISQQPRTKEGGFWHKRVYEWQMWLDGIYMGDVFLLQYANLFSKPELTEEGLNQIFTIYRHTLDKNTGLLYHGWDESKNKIWANQETGASPEFWGRGMGWYAMALADAIQYVPVANPRRDSLIAIFRNLTGSLLNFQDKNNGLWYQVVDKGSKEGNWIETSASAMFAYAFIKGFKSGILDQNYKTAAINAFNGLKNYYLFFDGDGKIYLTGTVKVGTLNFKYSNGSYDYYISVDRRVNDFKGVAALLYLTAELEFDK